MADTKIYPICCRKNILKLMYMLSTDAETAYAMIKMTALMMDLDLDDDRIVETILMDCDYLEVRA